jgi:transcriptional regulator with XRE-family HTH domain
MTQEQVAARMGTTASAISRLESGKLSRPTLTTIENYALVVGCHLTITVRPKVRFVSEYADFL